MAESKSLYEMSSKELRTCAKFYKVKNYWNLSKAVLIDEIEKAREEEAPKVKEIPIEPEAPEKEEPIAVETPAEVKLPFVKDEEKPKKADKRKNIIQSVTYQGRTQTVQKWSEETGIAYHTLYARINQLGWSLDKAFNKQSQRKKAG